IVTVQPVPQPLSTIAKSVSQPIKQEIAKPTPSFEVIDFKKVVPLQNASTTLTSTTSPSSTSSKKAITFWQKVISPFKYMWRLLFN
ncbi:MAG TPA: hypothetical protein VN457_07830, partial [Chlamydiales bacterium]|nr:hypothetical protein [Chlamydiales bacterium]